MNALPVQRASQIPADAAGLPPWLVQDLWSDQAVGILGGEPKCCKSFLALDLAVSVASGAPCLRRFAVPRPGPVLLFPAEDSLAVVRARRRQRCDHDARQRSRQRRMHGRLRRSLGRKGGGSDDDHAGGHHHAGWNVPDQEERRKNPVPADKGSLEEGKKLYATYCASCHGAQGRGDGPAGAGLTPRPSDLTHHAGRHRDGEVAWKIANGRSPMPAWKNTLTETQIWHLVNFLKSIATRGSRGSRSGSDDSGHHR